MRFFIPILALIGLGHGSQVCVDQNCAPRNLVADFVFLIDSSEALSRDDFEAVKEDDRAYGVTDELDVTEANGFRPTAKKVLVVIEGDEWAFWKTYIKWKPKD